MTRSLPTAAAASVPAARLPSALSPPAKLRPLIQKLPARERELEQENADLRRAQIELAPVCDESHAPSTSSRAGDPTLDRSGLTWHDISPWIRAVEAMLQNENALMDFFTAAPLGLKWVRPDGCIERANPAELELLDRTSDEVISQPLAGFHADPETIAHHPSDRLGARDSRGRRARARFGRELHDDLCQELLGIELKTEGTAEKWETIPQRRVDPDSTVA